MDQVRHAARQACVEAYHAEAVTAVAAIDGAWHQRIPAEEVQGVKVVRGTAANPIALPAADGQPLTDVLAQALQNPNAAGDLVRDACFLQRGGGAPGEQRAAQIAAIARATTAEAHKEQRALWHALAAALDRRHARPEAEICRPPSFALHAPAACAKAMEKYEDNMTLTDLLLVAAGAAQNVVVAKETQTSYQFHAATPLADDQPVVYVALLAAPGAEGEARFARLVPGAQFDEAMAKAAAETAKNVAVATSQLNA